MLRRRVCKHDSRSWLTKALHSVTFHNIPGYDEILTRIPNEQMANRRICNMSRMKKCRVRTTLRFRHSDWEKVGPVCKEIKQEIARECPALISDGSRPFRAFLTAIADDHLKVVVDARFNLPPMGNVFFENRDKVLTVILGVLKRNGIELALPAHHIISEESPRVEQSM